MLKITNDGRKLALDQRMLNDMLPDFEGSKINACVDNIYRIWKENADKKSAQLVFCDLSTPKNDGTFSVYNDIRKKLIERGIPESEVKFIHEADTDMKKKELFQKTRKGEVRVLLGSTQKMGAGTNVQDKLIALHDVDCTVATFRCRTDFADIQNKKECGGNRQWQNHYLRNWAANTKGKGII